MVTETQTLVYGGIDTHADTHHVAVIDHLGTPLGDLQVPATLAGYRAALGFLNGWPQLGAVGIECTGSYGAGVSRAAREAGLDVVEVNRPNRFDRRLQGKTDTFDAYAAAEAVLSGRANAAPKGGDGLVESLRVLRTSRSSALSARTATTNQIKAMLISGPEQLRSRYRGLSNTTAAQLLITAGDNPARLRSEAAFAALTGRGLPHPSILWQDHSTSTEPSWRPSGELRALSRGHRADPL